MASSVGEMRQRRLIQLSRAYMRGDIPPERFHREERRYMPDYRAGVRAVAQKRIYAEGNGHTRPRRLHRWLRRLF